MAEAAAHPSPEQRLADFAAELRLEDVPERVRHEARRSLVNVFATALAGCREPAVDIVVATSAPCTGPRAATLIGRSEGGDAGLAAFVNAMSANIFDFDDTHQATRSEEHTSELQSLMRISYAVFCLTKKKN